MRKGRKEGFKGDRETYGTLMAVIAAAISGGSIVANKAFVAGIDAALFTSVRSLVIGLAFLALMFYSSGFSTAGLRKQFAAAKWRYLLPIAIVGGAAAFLLFFSGLQLTTAGRAAFIQKTLPIYVAVFAYWFLKEKITMKQTYALIIMLLGAVLIFGSQIDPARLWSDPLTGDLLIAGATVLWAVENTLSRKAMLGGESNLIVSFSRMFIGGLILFGVAGVAGNLGMLAALTAYQWASIGASAAMLFGYVFFWYYSISLINVSKASAILLLAPVVSLGLGVLVLGEPAPAVQLAGSALILAGAYVVSSIKSEMSTGV